MARSVEYLQRGIQDRQRELHNISGVLAREARNAGRRAAWGKILTISLGAFVATQGTANVLWGEHNSAKLAVYTLAGLLIAAISGLEAAFKNESHAGELKSLAAEAQSVVWRTDSQWAKSVHPADGEQKFAAAQQLLDVQDAQLADLQSRAARLGINIVHQVREEYDERILPAQA